MQEPIDGVQDPETTTFSSGEGQPMPSSVINYPHLLLLRANYRQQLRRVLEPSEPPKGRHKSRATRTRRNRHWREMNRAADAGSSTTSSAMMSGETSVYDTTPPAVPAASPAEGVRS